MAGGYLKIWLDPHLIDARVEIWDQSYIGGEYIDLYVGKMLNPGWMGSGDPYSEPYYMVGTPFPASHLYRIKFPRQQVGGVWYEATQLPYLINFGLHKEDTIPITAEAVGIPTTTTISAPDSVAINDNFFISGILYETESSIPIPYQPINHSYNGRSLGGLITGVDGDYLKEVSIPESGTWTLKSDFPGTLEYKTSRSINMVTATSPSSMALQIIGSITVGAVLLAYSLG